MAKCAGYAFWGAGWKEVYNGEATLGAGSHCEVRCVEKFHEAAKAHAANVFLIVVDDYPCEGCDPFLSMCGLNVVVKVTGNSGGYFQVTHGKVPPGPPHENTGDAYHYIYYNGLGKKWYSMHVEKQDFPPEFAKRPAAMSMGYPEGKTRRGKK